MFLFDKTWKESLKLSPCLPWLIFVTNKCFEVVLWKQKQVALVLICFRIICIFAFIMFRGYSWVSATFYFLVNYVKIMLHSLCIQNAVFVWSISFYKKSLCNFLQVHNFVCFLKLNNQNKTLNTYNLYQIMLEGCKILLSGWINIWIFKKKFRI